MDKRRKMRSALAAALVGLLAALPCLAFTQGDTGDDVTRLQTALYALGYLEQAPDGHYGQRTAQAAQRLTVHARSQGLALEEEELAAAWADGRLQPVSGTLREGDASEAVLLTQRRLRALGYLADKADGRFGANTKRALMVLQHDQGLPLTGELDDATRPALFRADAQPALYPVLAKGMQNERVLALQTRLWQLGFFTGDLDGQFGDETVNGVKALKNYIVSCGLFDWDGALLNMTLNGVADPLVQAALFEEFPLPGAMKEGDSGQDVYRLQRRLMALGYLDQAADGGYGANTTQAVSAFRRQANMKGKGQANQETVALLFSDQAPEAVRPYKLVVDLDRQKLFVYQWKDGAYAALRYTMDCSVGPQVSAGSYRTLTRPGEEWLEVDGLGWVAWCYMLDGGLRIYSVPYDRQGGQVNTALLSALGARAQAGDIMVSPENARLIFEKCKARTPVEIVG